MGCDIHIIAERKTTNGYEAIKDVRFSEGIAPFDWRAYGMFGFLAGVRNYSDVTPISAPRGLPGDASKIVLAEYEVWEGDAHNASWLSVAELAGFDYDSEMEDRRVTKQTAHNVWDGGCTAEPGGGSVTTYREFLGQSFASDLAKLKECGADRVVFWFDN